MNFVKCENLVYEYKQYNEKEDKHETLKAVDNIDLEIPKGQFIAILGHNGSGKSTLAKNFNALLIPTSGDMWVNGYDTKNFDNIWKIRQSAGMVFQNPDNQLIATIVEEDVAFGPENLGIPSQEIRKRVDDSLKDVDMWDYRFNSPYLLSGGQKQRIAIAGILAMRPDCIILDEPTAMLDPMGRKEVIDTVLRLNRDEGITIILITHYMEEAVMADRVVVAEQGKIVMDDTPRNIFKQVDRLKQLKLDVPQVTEVATLLHQKGYNIDDDILTIDELVNQLAKLRIKTEAAFKPSINNKLSDSEPIIEINNLTHIYSEHTAFEKKALENINITINKGEFAAIIGHTGSGKSTLMQQLNGLIKPTSGEILLNGIDIHSGKINLKSIRQKVGLVFQYPEHQLFEMTIYKDVAFGPENMGLKKEEIDERVREALSLVGMDESFYDKSPFELSGGQKRRVAIAGVLAMHPEILVLDEPTAGLDPYGRDELFSVIKNMHDKLSMTIILVSHNMEDVAKLADKVIVMHQGKTEFIGTPSEVFSNSERLEEIGLSAPQISILMNKLKKRGINVPVNIYSIIDAVAVLESILIK